MIREPKTEPIPAPDPATPTVAAPDMCVKLRKSNLKEIKRLTGAKPITFSVESVNNVFYSPAPMNLAAESMSDLGAEVERRWEA